MNPSKIAVDLVSRRKAAGLTQREVAQRMGTTQSAIARAESNWETFPTLEFLERFARAVGKPITLTLGTDTEVSTQDVEARTRRAVGTYQFNPWERPLSDVEKEGLIREGLTPESFESQRTAGRRRKRT